ncbi:zinc finger protein 671-like [Lynx pardinus]|uniref:Zinc finger protein 671-like n=1 Tax=Lynx pardinus TaxID=191816 RepID=A0A485MQH6_LYNPA|nr:zinc finger protein 671-like [Lynx pardinus]
MAEAATETDRNIVTFEDVCIYFSREEWDLLDEAQKCLYCHVVLENFLLVTSLGLTISRYHLIPQPQTENKDASSGQGVFIRQSQVRTLTVDTYNQKSHPCDMCVPILKDILCLAGQQGISYEQEAYPCKSYGRTFWVTVNTDQILRPQSGEAFPRMEKDQIFSVKRCRSHMSEAFTYREDGEYSLASSGCV